jgi:hypothetical protein
MNTKAGLRRATTSAPKFKILHSPGETVPDSGIYRCTLCENEEVSVQGDTFPPCPHASCGGRHPRWHLTALPNHSRQTFGFNKTMIANLLGGPRL